MFCRLFCCLSVLALLAGCETPYKKKDEAEKQQLKNFASDQNFQAFVGRLRIAVAKRDREALASMMTGNFGYRYDAPEPGESIFQYWDMRNLWPVLEGVLRQPFVPNDNYMVAPPQVMSDPNYEGYRAGLILVGGSWKFAYFVPAEAAQ